MNTLILNWTSIVNVEKTSKIDFAEVQKTSFEYVCSVNRREVTVNVELGFDHAETHRLVHVICKITPQKLSLQSDCSCTLFSL